MKYYLIFFFLLTSCSKFVEHTDKQDYNSLIIESKEHKQALSLIFTHNINGELYPCGCRHFPLGGLAQVAGALAQVNKEDLSLFVSTGDIFFPSITIPPTLKRSLTFNAQGLANYLDQLGLKYIVPGDYDLSLGEEFLETLNQQHQWDFLISNYGGNKLNHRPYIEIKVANKHFIILGIIHPQSLPDTYQAIALNPEIAIQSILKKLDIRSQTKIILLSHSGMDEDIKLAQKFPQLNWIIGGHTQSFTTTPQEEGNTKIVQVLSKNHYLGRIRFDLGLNTEEFSLIETRDEMKDKLIKNPFISLLDRHKTDLKQIQIEEEAAMVSSPKTLAHSHQTYNSCVQCHQKQFDFWQETEHALAMGTLLKVGEERNPKCIVCHSLDFNQKNGPQNFLQLVKGSNEIYPDQFFKEYISKFNSISKVREATPMQRKKIHQGLMDLEQKYSVQANFASVQCLNCHQISLTHEQSPKGTKKVQTKRCLECHSFDQSPEWYAKDRKTILKTTLENAKQKVACPK